MHTLRSKCRHGKGSDVSPHECGEDVVRFVLYDLTKPRVPSSSVYLDHVDDLVQDQHCGFTLALLNSLLFYKVVHCQIRRLQVSFEVISDLERSS
ncbi:hypothetical protein Tco_0431980 [Tanacetum coccineum]